MANDVKNFLYSWCGKNKLNRPSYTWSENRSVLANGARSKQPDSFDAKLAIAGISYIATGNAKAIKQAQTEAASDMILFLLKNGRVKREQVLSLPNKSTALDEYLYPAKAQAKAQEEKFSEVTPANTLKALKSTYKTWVSTETTIGNETVKKHEAESLKLDVVSKESDSTQEVVFYGAKEPDPKFDTLDFDAEMNAFYSQEAPIVQAASTSAVSQKVEESPSSSGPQAKRARKNDWDYAPSIGPSSHEFIEAYQKTTNALMADSNEILLESTLTKIEQNNTGNGWRPMRKGKDAQPTNSADEPYILVNNNSDSSDTFEREETDQPQNDRAKILPAAPSSPASSSWSKITSRKRPHDIEEAEPEIQIINDISPRDVLSLEFAQSFGKQCNRDHPKAMARINNQIWKHYNDNKQDDAVFQSKMQIRQQLLRIIRTELGDFCHLFAVGSTINNCGSYNSDMDLCLVAPHPTCGTNTERSYAVNVLRSVRRVLYRRTSGSYEFVDNLEFIMAKVPIIRLELKPRFNSLEVDINCNNVAGILNSHLLHYYARVDDRFPCLALMIKHWAIANQINDAMNGTLNSYSLLLLVIHFLQYSVSPPVLPNLQEMFPQMFNENNIISDLLLEQDFPGPIAGHKANKQPVSELLAGFFSYYAGAFNFSTQAISIRTATVFPRSQLGGEDAGYCMWIEEPYERSNTARCVRDKNKMDRIVGCLRRAKNMFQKGPDLRAVGVSV